MKISHQEILDGFCKYFEDEKNKRQKKFGFCDIYLENLKSKYKTSDKVKPSSNATSKRRS